MVCVRYQKWQHFISIMHLWILLFLGESFLKIHLADARITLSSEACRHSEYRHLETGECRHSEYRHLETGECRSCDACPPGFGVVSPCTETTNTKCVTCRQGYFSDLFSADSICYYCAKCGEGRKVVKQCTRYSDTKCSDCVPGYFRSTLSGRCVKCGLCPPVRTAYNPILAECNKSGVPENQQCIPDIYFLYKSENEQVEIRSTSVHTSEATSSYDFTTFLSNITITNKGQLPLATIQYITTGTIVALVTGVFLILILVIMLHKKGCIFRVSHNQDETAVRCGDLPSNINEDSVELQTYTVDPNKSYSSSSSYSSSTKSVGKLVSTDKQSKWEKPKLNATIQSKIYSDAHLSKGKLLFPVVTEDDSSRKLFCDLNGNTTNVYNKNNVF